MVGDVNADQKRDPKPMGDDWEDQISAGSGYSETFIPDSRTVGVNEVAGEFGFLCVDDINACKFNRLECPVFAMVVTIFPSGVCLVDGQSIEGGCVNCISDFAQCVSIVSNTLYECCRAGRYRVAR